MLAAHEKPPLLQGVASGRETLPSGGMEAKGHELPPETTGKQGVESPSGAESGARGARTAALADGSGLPPDERPAGWGTVQASTATPPQDAPAAPPDARLAAVVNAWPALPEAIKVAAHALIQSAAKGG